MKRKEIPNWCVEWNRKGQPLRFMATDCHCLVERVKWRILFVIE
jgi:hypothetical protein